MVTNCPAIRCATGPNVDGTADFGDGLAKTLTIDVNPAFATTEVSFALFNGETSLQSCVVCAYNGRSLLGSQTVANILPNFDSGLALVDMISAAGITSVTVNADSQPGTWDFLIDTMAFNQSITTVVPNAPPPPVTVPPVTTTYTEPDEIDELGHKQKGKTRVVFNQVINDGDDINDAKRHFETLSSPVPESSTSMLLLAGLAGLAVVGFKTVRGTGRSRCELAA